MACLEHSKDNYFSVSTMAHSVLIAQHGHRRDWPIKNVAARYLMRSRARHSIQGLLWGSRSGSHCDRSLDESMPDLVNTAETAGPANLNFNLQLRIEVAVQCRSIKLLIFNGMNYEVWSISTYDTIADLANKDSTSCNIRVLIYHSGGPRQIYTNFHLASTSCNILVPQIIEHIAIASVRAHIGANKVLELGSVGTTGVLVFTKDSGLVGNLDITPLAVEIQPVDGIAGIISCECSGGVVITIRIVVANWIPECTVAGIVVYWAEGKVDTGDRVVVNSAVSQKILVWKAYLEQYTHPSMA